MRRQRDEPAKGLLGPLEYEIMSELWVCGSATVPVVHERVNARRTSGDALAYTTVMTVLARLHTKGLVERERLGRGYSYAPTFDELGLVQHLSGQEVRDLLDRYGDVALAQFAAALEDADPALRARLRQLGARDDG